VCIAMERVGQLMRDKAKDILSSGEVDLVIGYGVGSLPYRTTPVFIDSADDTDELIWNLFCINNLVMYVNEPEFIGKRLGIIVKSCDARAIVRLLNDNQIERESLLVINVPCTGMIDPDKLCPADKARSSKYVQTEEHISVRAEEYEKSYNRQDVLCNKCHVCTYSYGFEYDCIIGDAPDERQVNIDDCFRDVLEFEKLPVSERHKFWQAQFAKCIRCFACRNLCTACSCRECVFDQVEPEWLRKSTDVMENMVFHITRAMHVADRCVGCDECERACPVNIPMSKLYKKLHKDACELFDLTPFTIESGEKGALSAYRVDDPDEFL
jgi:formate dehydrogenase subunit beta